MNADEAAPSKGTGVVKHDIKNQLSNISLALEQLRFEVPDQNEDSKYYMDTIFSSVKKINTLLDDL
jgi:nitrogen-specific signal transduction histidine kinase